MRARTWLWALVVTLPTVWLGACSSEEDDDVTTGPSGSSSSGAGATGGSGATGGTGGGGSGTGGFGGSIEGTDACPGAELELAIGQTIVASGDTTSATDDYTTFCGDMTVEPDTGDLVFQLTTAAAGTLRVQLDDSEGFDGVVSLRKVVCEARNPLDDCINLETDGEDHQLDMAQGTYYLVVDGANGTKGTFDMVLTLSEPTCGDGVVNTSVGEQCDPTDVDPEVCNEPGAADECKLAPPPVADLETCPGYGVTINAGDDLVLGVFNNTTYGDEHVGTCAGANVGGRDNVFRFTPTATGTLSVTIGNDPNTGAPWCDTCGGNNCPDGDGCWAMILYARTGTCEQATGVEAACSFDATFVDPTPSISFPVTQGVDVWVYVDSTFNGTYTAGPYYLEASLD